MKTNKLTHKTFILLLLSLVGFTAKATPIIGSEITYRNIDTLTYEVKFLFYRECSGVKFTGINSTRATCGKTGNWAQLSLTLVSVEEVRIACDTMGAQCAGSNQSFSGQGVERLVFVDTVDFRKAPFNKVAGSGCSDIRFSYSRCCRGSSVTTGAASSNEYNYALLNLDYPENSSPDFQVPVVPLLRTNEPVYQSVAVGDAEGDSVSYKLVTPLEDFNKSVSVQVPFITTYYPSGFKYPYSNPKTNPPIGLYFGEKDGNLVFTPVKNGEYTVMVVEVTEWRKDTSGKMVKIGLVRREMSRLVRNMKGNNPPIIKVNEKYEMCEGVKTCFTIETEDNVVVPPPPSPKPDPDTTTLVWFGGPDGSTFDVTTGVQNQSAKFCWTPKVGQARTRPYYITVQSRDNNCPKAAVTSKSIALQVNKLASAKTTIDSVGCGRYAIESSPETSIKKPIYSWAVLDMSGKAVSDSDRLRFGTTGKTTSTNKSDTLYFIEPGSYIVRHTIDQIGLCARNYDDTLVIKDSDVRPLVKMPADTSFCYDAGDLNLRMIEDSTTPGGKWFCPAANGVVIDDSMFRASGIGSLTKTVKLQVHYERRNAANLCPRVDSFQVEIHPLPVVKLMDKQFCQRPDALDLVDEVVALPGGASIALGRQTWACVDCGTYDPAKLLEDRGSGGAGAPQDYVLHIDRNTLPIGTNNPVTLSLELEYRDYKGCKNKDTSIITIYKTPQINFNGFPTLCWDEGKVDLKQLSQVTPNDGIWKALDSTGYAPASNLNKALRGDTTRGDTLTTMSTPRPSEGTSFTYFMRYYHDRSGCPTYRDTMLTLRGLPEPKIDRNDLTINTIGEPYQFCELNSDIALSSANYNGGTWSSQISAAMSGNTFKPSAVSNYNSPFKIYYHFTDIFGCMGSDSVQVEIHPEQEIEVPKDTVLTWWGNTMNFDVTGSFANSTGMYWLPLTGGTVSNATATTTNYSFPARKDTITRHLLYAKTNEGGGTVCPFAEKTMVITIHPDPCIEYDIDYDLSGEKMTLKPLNDLMQSYRWEVGDTSTTTKQPVIDVSSFKDTTVWVYLITVNQLGDSCRAQTKINLKTGSVRDLRRQLNVYPNPVENHFVLDTDLPGVKHIRVLDATGRVAKEMTIEGSVIQCGDLSSGVYTFLLEHENRTYVGRFVKE